MKFYEQSLDLCFGKPGFIAANHLTAQHGKAEEAMEKLWDWYEKATLPLLRLPETYEDLRALTPHIQNFQRFHTVVILGTGGSSLGGQTLYSLADQGFGNRRGKPRLYFMDNVDPVTFEALFNSIDVARTGFICISKSGGTAETLMQTFFCFGEMQKRLGAKTDGHFLIITEPGNNPMRAFATRNRLSVLDHDPQVGGRFSVLSVVGLLPAMIAGIDAFAVREGANTVLKHCLNGSVESAAPVQGALLAVGYAGKSQTVLMPYVDQLAYFGLWYRQLWAESLGKDGKGTTPIRAMGTVDQHSQLQLYLQGPKDKLFTVLIKDCARSGSAVHQILVQDPRLAYLTGKPMGALLDAEQRATIKTLYNNDCPVRVIRIGELDERTMGALLMHFMLETIIAAHLLDVDAFDQPAVEEGKVLTRAYLQDMPAVGIGSA
jgi:glucose-6-phosphate isomerase